MNKLPQNYCGRPIDEVSVSSGIKDVLSTEEAKADIKAEPVVPPTLLPIEVAKEEVIKTETRTADGAGDIGEGTIVLDTGDATQDEIDKAATKMQATFRGKKSRELVKKKKEEKVAYVSADAVAAS